MTTTTRDAFEAALDAIILDNGLNQNGFENAIQSVLTANFNNAEADAYVTAIVAEYFRLGINTATYSNFRNSLLNAGKVASLALWDALNPTISGLPEASPAEQSAFLISLRDERDNIDAAIDRFNVLIAAEPNGTVGRLVKDEMRAAKVRLRERKQAVRDAIQAITGDPDN